MGTHQVGMLRSDALNKWLTAGNRAGKTIVGVIEDVADALNLHPITKAPRQPQERFDKAPVRMWVVSDTEEVSIKNPQMTIYHEVLGTDESGFMWNFVDDSCKFSDSSGWSDSTLRFTNGAWIQFKFSSQKRKTFQGVKLHKVHMDEVQPKAIYDECLARLADFNGYMLGTMTPLEDRGLPWIYEDLYVPRADKGIEFWQWSMLDNPYISDAAKRRLMRQWGGEDEAIVAARNYGAIEHTSQRMAFNHQLVRRLRDNITPPEHGELELTGDGAVTFHKVA